MLTIVEKDGIRYTVGDENSLTAFLDSGFVVVAPEKKEEPVQEKEAVAAEEKPVRKRTRRKG